ncbi:MAG: AsnC family transcriptional regulator [Candidatus Desulfofervidaceae bacterium]|nr:AsnC family transcriptional regulator [Candidatus Desulfofervidaceae bacterium]
MVEITELDKKIIRELQKDLPLEKQPFSQIAKRIGIEEEALLKRIQEFIQSGIIRRFGATIYHNRSGFEANVMVAWKVPEEEVDRVGETMAKFPEVTHCYARVTFPEWPYNLYTMVHGRNEEECLAVVEKIATATGVKNYRLLFTEDTFKRATMEYF